MRFRWQMLANAITSYLGYFVAFLSIFIVVPALRKYVGTDTLSVWFLCFSFTSFADFALSSISQSSLLAQKEENETSACSKGLALLFWLLLIFSLVLTIVYYSLLYLDKFSLRLDTLLAQGLTSIALIVFFRGINLIFASRIHHRHESYKVNFINLFSTLLYLGLFYPVCYHFKSLSSVFAFAVLIDVIKSALTFYFSGLKISHFRKTVSCLGKKPDSYTRKLLLVGVTTTLGFRVDLLLVSWMTNAHLITCYGAAQRLYNIPQNMAWQLPTALLPSLVQIREEKEKVLKLIFMATRLALFILIFSITPIVFYGEQFFKLWVGQEFSRDSQILLLCLVPHLLINTQHSVISIWLKSVKEMEELTRFYIRVNVLNFLLSLLLGWLYGAHGIALATTIAFLLLEVSFLNVSFQLLQISWSEWSREILKPTGIFLLVLVSLGLYFRDYHFLQSPVHDLGLIALYLSTAAIVWLGLDGWKQLKQIRG